MKESGYKISWMGNVASGLCLENRFDFDGPCLIALCFIIPFIIFFQYYLTRLARIIAFRLFRAAASKTCNVCEAVNFRLKFSRNQKNSFSAPGDFAYRNRERALRV